MPAMLNYADTVCCTHLIHGCIEAVLEHVCSCTVLLEVLGKQQRAQGRGRQGPKVCLQSSHLIRVDLKLVALVACLRSRAVEKDMSLLVHGHELPKAHGGQCAQAHVC